MNTCNQRNSFAWKKNIRQIVKNYYYFNSNNRSLHFTNLPKIYTFRQMEMVVIELRNFLTHNRLIIVCSIVGLMFKICT